MNNNSLCLRKNLGKSDRVLRFIVGGALVVAPLFWSFSPLMSVLLAAMGGAQIIEGITAY